MKKITIALSIIAAGFFTACSSSDNFNGTFTTDTNSVVEWKGSSLETFNTGSFDVRSDDIIFENGRLKSGSFTMPVVSIRNFNIENADVREQLLTHLKSSDFFNMALHPESKFVITHVTEIDDVPPGAIAESNYIISENFTMCGVTKPISIPAKIILAGKKLTIESTFAIDRTLWGMNYAADPALGAHHILPKVDLHLKLTATQQ